MENLFNSCIFNCGSYVSTLCHGFVRTNGHGLPDLVIMKEEKCKNMANWMRGTTKAAMLKNCAECPDLLVCSVYDIKMVHMMSTASETMEWI